MKLEKKRVPLIDEESHVDLIYLAIAAIVFLLSGWLISALERL